MPVPPFGALQGNPVQQTGSSSSPVSPSLFRLHLAPVAPQQKVSLLPPLEGTRQRLLVLPGQQVLSEVQGFPDTFLHFFFFFLCFLASASGAASSAPPRLPAASALSALRRVPARDTIRLSLSKVDHSMMVLRPVPQS